MRDCSAKCNTQTAQRVARVATALHCAECVREGMLLLLLFLSGHHPSDVP